MGEKGNGGGPADTSTAVHTSRSNIKNNDEVDPEGPGTTASDSGTSAEDAAKAANTGFIKATGKPPGDARANSGLENATGGVPGTGAQEEREIGDPIGGVDVGVRKHPRP
jgi:hypothetical protein